VGIKAKVDLDLPAMMAQKTKVVGRADQGRGVPAQRKAKTGHCREARITGPGKVKVKLPDGNTPA